MKDTILEIKNLSHIYKDEDTETQALDNASFTVKEGEFVSIIGASGCGKTTILRMIAGLQKVKSGEISLKGSPEGIDKRRIGYVFQQKSLYDWMTIEQNIAYGLKAKKQYRQKKHLIGEYLKLIDLEGFEKSYPHQISGGMAQRVAIARALINDPEILLLDEPMGALDSFTRANLQDKLLELKALKNTTMILVTHDVDEAIYLSDKIIIMTPRPGRISEILDVNLPYPRNRGDVSFMEIRRKLMEKFSLASEQVLPEYFI